jgi:hypothetical protein
MPTRNDWQSKAARAAIATLAALLASCGEPSPETPADADVMQAGVALIDAPDHTPQPIESRVFEAPFGPVRITELAVEHPSHAHSGALSVTYLKREDGKLSAIRDFPLAVRSGSYGRLGTWTVDDRFSTLPVIVTEGGGTWQGQTCMWTTITELRPTGPVELITFQQSLSTDGLPDGEPQEVAGSIAAIERDRGFTVRFAGTREFEATYRRQGDQYVTQGGDNRALHGC